jgi:hypothetical protein
MLNEQEKPKLEVIIDQIAIALTNGEKEDSLAEDILARETFESARRDLRNFGSLQYQAIYGLSQFVRPKSLREIFDAAGALMTYHPKLIGSVLIGKAKDALFRETEIQLNAASTSMALARHFETSKGLPNNKDAAYHAYKQAFEWINGVKIYAPETPLPSAEFTQMRYDTLIGVAGNMGSGFGNGMTPEFAIKAMDALTYTAVGLAVMDQEATHQAARAFAAQGLATVPYVPLNKRLATLADLAFQSARINHIAEQDVVPEQKIWDALVPHVMALPLKKRIAVLSDIKAGSPANSKLGYLANDALIEVRMLPHDRTSKALRKLNSGLTPG